MYSKAVRLCSSRCKFPTVLEPTQYSFLSLERDLSIYLSSDNLMEMKISVTYPSLNKHSLTVCGSAEKN